MNRIDKDTQVCISLSSNPGNVGTILHNAAYEKLNLNYIYKSFSTNNIKYAIKGVKVLGIKGCSISMPFKSDVVKLVDRLDRSAKN